MWLLWKLFKKEKTIKYEKKSYDLLNVNKMILETYNKKLKNDSNLKKLKKDVNDLIKKLRNIETKFLDKVYSRILYDVTNEHQILYSFYGMTPILNPNVFFITEYLRNVFYFKVNILYKELLKNFETDLDNRIVYTEDLLLPFTNFYSIIETFDYNNVILDKYFSYSLIKDNKIAKTQLIEKLDKEKLKKEISWKTIFNNQNSFILLDELWSWIKVYFSAWLTVEELKENVIILYDKITNLKIRKKEIIFVDQKKQFNQVLDYLTSLTNNDISILHNIKTMSIKKYFITSLSEQLDIWDFSLFLRFSNWKMLYGDAEVEWKDGYKIIEEWRGLNYETILDDLRILWVELNGITTLRNIVMADGIWFRISVIVRNDSFAVSIRKNSKWYANDDILKAYNFSNDLILKESDLKAYSIEQKHVKNEKITVWEKKNSFFPLESFFNYKKDYENILKLYGMNWGVTLLVWTVWHWKSSFLKTLTKNYFEYYLKTKKIRKKVLFFEAPIETTYRDFYQISYLLEYPKQLEDLIKSAKTQNPQMVVIWETKDPETMKQVYDIAWLTQSFTTLHNSSVIRTIQYLNDIAKVNKTNIITYLKQTNWIIVQNKVSDIIKDDKEVPLENRLKNMVTKEEIIKYYYLTFNMETPEKTNKYFEKMEELYTYTLNYQIEEWLKTLLENKENLKYDNLLDLYNMVITKIGIKKEESLKEKLEQMFSKAKYKLYRENLEWFKNTVWIVNELVLSEWIEKFFRKEWSIKIVGDKEIFYSLDDLFEEDTFISKLSNNFYKYMKIDTKWKR